VQAADTELARALFIYDPETGALRWRVDRVVQLRNHATVKARAGDLAGWLNDSGYRVVMFKRRKRRATTIIWLIVHGGLPEHEVDHINGNQQDDRLCNLRDATPRQNRYNTKLRANNKSGHKGVCWSKQAGAWRATIKADGKQKHLGFFDRLEDAASAYAKAAQKFHGEFARVR
jgi:hypothetical protein